MYEVTIDISCAVKIKVPVKNADEAVKIALERIASLGTFSYRELFYVEAKEIEEKEKGSVYVK